MSTKAILHHLDTSLAHARQRIVERDGYLNQSRAHGRGALVAKRLGTYYGGIMLQRTFDCPVDLVKTIRVDEQFDGGKWLCGLNYVGTPCTVYSLGSNFDASFETYVQGHVRQPCDVHIYDPTLRVHGEERLAAFRTQMRSSLRAQVHEVGLATNATGGAVQIRLFSRKDRLKWSKGGDGMTSFPAQTLEEMLASNGHNAASGHCVDIVKVDVEGVESSLLRHTPWSRLCIGILLVEVHAEDIEKREGAAFTIGELARGVRRLEAAGMMLYSSEVVCGQCNGQAELGFVNATWLRDRVKAMQVAKLPNRPSLS